MDEKQFKERAARLTEICKVLEKVPSEFKAEAFDLLKPYVTGGAVAAADPTKRAAAAPAVGDESELFTAHADGKPADNVKLIAASFYQTYGSAPFSVDEVRAKANEVGITIPARPDATLNSTAEKGKKLFMGAGKGKYKPTVHGEAHLKTAYGVKKGTATRPGDDG